MQIKLHLLNVLSFDLFRRVSGATHSAHSSEAPGLPHQRRPTATRRHPGHTCISDQLPHSEEHRVAIFQIRLRALPVHAHCTGYRLFVNYLTGVTHLHDRALDMQFVLLAMWRGSQPLVITHRCASRLHRTAAPTNINFKLSRHVHLPSFLRLAACAHVQFLYFSLLLQRFIRRAFT